MMTLFGEDTAAFVAAETARQRQMGALKQVPVSVARALLRGGQDAISHAKSVAAAKSLPGSTDRDTVFYKLQWHQNELAKLSDPNAMYAPGNDLKTWVTAAFRESDVADIGAGWIANAWNVMWSDIGKAIAALPALLRDEMKKAVENITGVPLWALAVGGVGLVGLAAFFVYKMANTSAGAAVAGAYTGRRK